MAFAGVLGTSDSQLGSIELGVVDDTVGGGPTISVGISESISFVESATYPLVTSSASESLALEETAAFTRRLSVSVSETISFAESQPVVGPQYTFTANRLNLVEQADGHLSLSHQLVAEGLLLVERAGRRLSVTVSEVMALVDSTKPPTKIKDVLALIEAAVAKKGQRLSDAFDFTEVASVIGTFGRSASETLALLEAASYFVLKPSSLCTYSPAIGSAIAGYTAPSGPPPTLGTGTLTLTYPFTSPTSTLVLRNPDFGNSDKLTFNRLNQQTRGGTLIVFADPQWPKFKTKSFQVRGLSDAVAASLLQFLEDSLGQEIGVLDWEGRQWRGLITNPDGAVTHAGKCNHTVSIEFEGDLA